MKIKSGDKVRVLTGKDRNKEGKVIQVFPDLERVVVDVEQPGGLPDPLDQNPGESRPEESLKPRGSDDAQLLAEAEAGEGDVESAGGQVND